MNSSYDHTETPSKRNQKTPRQRFQKVGIDRAENIVKAIELFGNCHNQYTYEYEEQEIKRIFKEIRATLKKTELLFLHKSKKTNGSVFGNIRDQGSR